MTSAPTHSDASWKSAPERGSVIGIRVVVFLSKLFGRGVASAILRLVSGYYALTDRTASAASRDFLRRVGVAPTFRNVTRHLHTFALVTLDRFLFLMDETSRFDVHLHGHEHLVAALQPTPDGRRRGALLLGSHVGSFDAMRALARKYDVPISIVADFENARRINGILSQLNPNLRARMIAVDPESASTVLEIKRCIDDGELVAILGDRTTQDERRTVSVDFLGEAAHFPMGPYLLAHLLGCPVFIVYSLLGEGARYDLFCEPFSERVRLPRGERQTAIAELAGRYAEHLGAVVRRSPFNWFNFYDFWRATEPKRLATEGRRP